MQSTSVSDGSALDPRRRVPRRIEKGVIAMLERSGWGGRIGKGHRRSPNGPPISLGRCHLVRPLLDVKGGSAQAGLRVDTRRKERGP